MKKIFTYGLAVFCFLTLITNSFGQKKTTDVEITGHVYEPAKLAPTVARIKSLKLPDGFQISKFAEIANPRMIAVSDNGTIYVSQRDAGTLTMLKDRDGDGAADVQMVVAEKKMMHGIAIDGAKMYLVTVNEVFVTDIKPDGTLGELKMIIDDLPEAGQHPNRTIAAHNGKLYISVGSTCNACHESNVENATILQADMNGKNRKIYASGLRNTIGFGWHPTSGKMFGMDHGIDWLGDNDQPEELNELIEGKKYGWAYAYADGKINPQDEVPAKYGLTNEQWAAQSENPVLMYTPHAAPLQMLFYTGSQFPAEYKNDAFVAFRGSWNRIPPSGYEVVRIKFDKSGNPTAFEPFLTGFLVKGGADDGKDGQFARIAGLAQLKDGSMLVTDDTNNIIYRVWHGKNTMPPIMSREDISMSLAETANAPKTIQVKSEDFENMGMIPDKYSAYFEDTSPYLSWTGVPKEAQSIVVMMEDPDASLKPVTHWLVANLSPRTVSMGRNQPKIENLPAGAIQGGNHTGKIGYYGMMPPPDDKPHGYHFQVFALDTMLKLPNGFNRQALLDAMKNHVVAKGEIVGMYQRKPDYREKK